MAKHGSNQDPGRTIIRLFGTDPANLAGKPVIAEMKYPICPVDGRICSCRQAARVALLRCLHPSYDAATSQVLEFRRDLEAYAQSVVADEQRLEQYLSDNPEHAKVIQAIYDQHNNPPAQEWVKDIAGMRTWASTLEGQLHGYFAPSQCEHWTSD